MPPDHVSARRSGALHRTIARWLCAALSLLTATAQAETCTVSATGAAFGVYSVSSPVANDTVATVTVTCSAVIALLVTYSLQVTAGGGGTYANRRMTNGTSNLSYQLHADLLRTKIWGDGSGGSVVINDGYLLGIIAPVIKLYPIYGRIPAGQNVSAGGYTDNLVVTITY